VNLNSAMSGRPQAVDGEEAQTGGGQAVKMTVGVRHQFVSFFAGGI